MPSDGETIENYSDDEYDEPFGNDDDYNNEEIELSKAAAAVAAQQKSLGATGASQVASNVSLANISTIIKSEAVPAAEAEADEEDAAEHSMPQAQVAWNYQDKKRQDGTSLPSASASGAAAVAAQALPAQQQQRCKRKQANPQRRQNGKSTRANCNLVCVWRCDDSAQAQAQA